MVKGQFYVVFAAVIMLFGCQSSPHCKSGDCLDGAGVYEENGFHYEGDFKEGQFDGQGEMTMENAEGQRHYIGSWKQGKMHGKGVLTMEDEAVYSGEFEDGFRHGHGTLNFTSDSTSNDDFYEGEWKQDVRTGHGFYRWGGGMSYRGGFLNNQMHGQGTFYFGPDSTNCEIYRGEMVHNARSGFGTLQWPNGDTYEGNWVNDLRHGSGRYIFADGTVFEGEWIENECEELLVVMREKNPELFSDTASEGSP